MPRPHHSDQPTRNSDDADTLAGTFYDVPFLKLQLADTLERRDIKCKRLAKGKGRKGFCCKLVQRVEGWFRRL